jgi:hypothetical protein
MKKYKEADRTEAKTRAKTDKTFPVWSPQVTLSGLDDCGWTYQFHSYEDFLERVAEPILAKQGFGIKLCDYCHTADDNGNVVAGHVDVAGPVTADHPDLPEGMDVTVRVDISDEDLEKYGSANIKTMLIVLASQFWGGEA